MICQITSILCSLFVLYHMLSSSTQRQSLANHVIIVILIISFLSVTIDLSITLTYLHQGTIDSQSSFLCYFWMFIDYVLYAEGMLIIAWASIERHILIFASQWFHSSCQKFFIHYFPILLSLIYPIIFYIYTIFFYSCDHIID